MTRRLPVLGLVLSGLVIAALYGYREYWLNLFPVRNIRVEGELNHVNPAAIRKRLAGHAANPYFLVNLSSVAQDVRQCAWIDRAQVSRIWPDTLRVWIIEQKPVAIWKNTGFLNQRGELFFVDSLEGHARLPRLDGPSAQEKRLLAALHTLNKAWKAQGIQVAGLTLSESLAWSLEFDSGLRVVFGKQDPLLATQRLQGILPALGEQRFGELAALDLRYPSGMALVWKPDAVRNLSGIYTENEMVRQRSAERADTLQQSPTRGIGIINSEGENR
ncbi:MAG: hypothetical protein RLZZ226_553 [Pseudomonadota bacterium]